MEQFYFFIIIFLIIISTIFIYILVLLMVAFFTLVERKIMGAIQRRLGPNVIGLNGLLQPFADGLKLLTKENIIPLSSNSFLFKLAPVWAFFFSLVGWCFIPFNSLGCFIQSNQSLLILLLISSLNIYGVLLGGWSSGSKYALLGSIRSVAQMISYEIIFAFSLMPIIILVGSLSLYEIAYFTSNLFCFNFFFYFLGFLPLSVVFFIIILAETNRAPFDLPEAEAELVAGFNVEYSGFLFALYFLGEYSSILLMCSLHVIFFEGAWSFPYINYFFVNNIIIETFFFSLKLFFLSFLFVWVRATFPRLRFDQLMLFCWEFFLPITFCYLYYFIILIIFYY